MNILWLLFLIPLLTAAVIHFGLKQKFASIAAILGTISTGATLVISYLWLTGSFTEPAAIDWIKVGSFNAQLGLVSDQLAKGMMMVVCGIGFLVHVF